MSSDYPPPPPPPPPSYGYGYGYGAPAPPPFDATSAFGFGWKAFWRRPGPFLLVTLLIGLVTIATSVPGSLERSSVDVTANPNPVSVWWQSSLGEFSGLSLLVTLVGAVVNGFLNAALVRGALDTVDGRQVTVGSMFARWDRGQVVLAAVIVAAMVSAGSLLCLLPGLVLAFLTWFASFFIVDRRLSAWDGITASFRFTARNVGSCLLCGLLAVLFVIAGALACLVGLLAAYPMIVLAGAYAFRRLPQEPAVA
jgi:hypothetical protein